MKKEKYRVVPTLWPTADLMDKELLVNIENQSVTKIKTGHTYVPQLSGGNEYYQINYSRKGKIIRLLLHNILFYHKHRYLPEEIDHIDFNKLNNSIDNLRPLTSGENRRYRRKKKKINGRKATSKHIGVHLDKRCGYKKWVAKISIPKDHPDYKDNIEYKNKKRIEKYLGIFENEDDAGQAVNDEIRRLGLEGVFVLNDTPQERARKLNPPNEK